MSFSVVSILCSLLLLLFLQWYANYYFYNNYTVIGNLQLSILHISLLCHYNFFRLWSPFEGKTILFSCFTLFAGGCTAFKKWIYYDTSYKVAALKKAAQVPAIFLSNLFLQQMGACYHYNMFIHPSFHLYIHTYIPYIQE